MGISTGEISNDFPTSMVLDDQIFSMSIVAQHRLETRREILTAEGVDDDTRVLFHLLNRGLLDQEVMDRLRDVSGPLYPIALNVIRPLIWPD